MHRDAQDCTGRAFAGRVPAACGRRWLPRLVGVAVVGLGMGVVGPGVAAWLPPLRSARPAASIIPAQAALPSAAVPATVLPATADAPATLPGTEPLTLDGDLAARMVEGIHRFLDRALAESPSRRAARWKLDCSNPERFDQSAAGHRERLRKALGLVDARLPVQLDYVGGPRREPLLAEAERFRVWAVRWRVLPGVDGEGLLLEPRGAAVGVAVVVPDADWTPEMLVGLTPGLPPAVLVGPRLADAGVRVLVPVLIDRSDAFSVNHALGRGTNQPHREFVHRMAYEMGRTLPGYELQKIFAAIDWLVRETPPPARERVALIGYGEGAFLARFAAALDPRIRLTAPFGFDGAVEAIHEQPFYRDIWGLATEWGVAELAALAWPRVVLPSPVTEAEGRRQLRAEVGWPRVAGPPPPRPGRSGAAPGSLDLPPLPQVEAEQQRLVKLLGGRASDDPIGQEIRRNWPILADGPAPAVRQLRPLDDPQQRQQRQFEQLVAYTQRLWRTSEPVRRQFWSRADAASPQTWERSCSYYRDYFHTEVIGRLPEPQLPLRPRSRKVYDEPGWTGYEVVLDVYPDVFAYGILLLPKDLRPGERRPVVVCQHGLEGTPRHTIDPEKYPVYDRFARRLVERGYVVYAPQNPYYGSTRFRQIQRKAHLLKWSLFSFIVRQHQRTLDWLEQLPFVDPQRIAFYGLSYGGKTAMRVPAIETRYCLSICSGDFNEWVGKCVSVDLDRSYMWTMEYDMYEFDLGHTFNYAEMGYLIAPRPFMVERGHDDGVGTDEMVAYEYAKVRYLYQNRLKIGDRTAIEFFPGGHRIHGVGTFAFLQKHLQFPVQDKPR